MKIDPVTKSIKELLSSGHQFIIPRFQREYSWEKKNNEEFLRDVISNIKIQDGKPIVQPYFLGAMLFVGNLSDSTQKEIQVVDGQQRLTTITILFSAISDVFVELGHEDLSLAIFKYVMTSDDDGRPVRTLQPKSSFPFFSYYIQDRGKNDIESQPATEEEECILETYKYFKLQLQEATFRKLCEKFNVGKATEIAEIEYVELIKALRDQILACVAVTMSSADEKQAYRIFEILNGKGKKLQFIDLIKNKIFEILQQTEPVDFAEDRWRELRETVSESASNSGVGLGTYYRHYWQSKYSRAGANQLYEVFKKTIPESELDYKAFLKDLVKNAKNYIKIVHPKREDYDNKKQYFGVAQSFNVLSNYFAVAQVRVVILALMDCREKAILSLGKYKEVINYLENFHFAYNALMKGRANVLDPIYSQCAINLRNAKNRAEVNTILQNDLYAKLDGLFPDFDGFKEQFIKLEYTKYSDSSANVRCKYVVHKLFCYFEGCELFDDEATIEHILPEGVGGVRYNIGNLIDLEDNLNNEAGQEKYDNKLSIYAKSKYKWVSAFVAHNPNWEESMIRMRATALADIYYYNIMKRPKIN